MTVDVTKSDLSHNHANVDYMAMLETSRIAFAHCTEKVSQYLFAVRAFPRKRNVKLIAQWLLEEARQLAIAAETMYVLEEGLDREELEVINKPKEVHNEV